MERTSSASRTLASARIGEIPRSRSPRSLLATLREWTVGGVLLVALPAAGCLSQAEALDVDGELRSLSQEIVAMEVDDADGTPLADEERIKLHNLYSQRDSLRAYRQTFGPDTGATQAAGWLTRLMGGDPTAIGAAVGSVASALYGRKVYKTRKAKREQPTQPPAPEPTAEPEPEANAETLEELTRELLATARKTPI